MARRKSKSNESMVAEFARLASELAVLNPQRFAEFAAKMKRAKEVDRGALVATVTRSVEYLVARDEDDFLDTLTECAGWIYNFQCVPPAAETGAAMIALAPVLPLEHLEDLAHGAVFYEHRSRRKSINRADALADDALRAAGVDVDARNAKISGIEERIMRQAVQ